MTYFSLNCSMKTSTTVLYFFSVSVMKFNAGGGPVQMREMPGDQVKLHLADDPAGEHGRYLGQRLGNLLPGKVILLRIEAHLPKSFTEFSLDFFNLLLLQLNTAFYQLYERI